MLSSPLPADYPVPTALLTFALHVLEGAVRSPSAATLRLLYTLLKGVGSDLLRVLPPPKFTHLQEQLIKLLRNFEDHNVNLLCLAVFALLCSNQPVWPVPEEPVSSLDSLALEASTEGRMQDICCAARPFFTLKAQKTIELVVLRSIMLCSSSTNPSDAISGLMLIREILDTVDATERSGWVQKNTLKVRKLQEKVGKPDMDRTVRLVAFDVIAVLAGAKSLSDELMAAIEGLLQQKPSNYHANKIWRAYAASFSEAFMKSQISRALRAAMETDRSSINLVEINDLRLFVGTLAELVQTDLAVRQMLIVITLSNSIQELLRRLLACTTIQAKNITRHGRQELCMAYIAQVRWLLGRDLCVLLLKSAFSTASAALTIDRFLATSLLEYAASGSRLYTPCDPCPLARPRRESAALVPSKIPHKSIDLSCSQDWRVALKETLDTDAANRHKFVVRRVNELCRDFEYQYNDAERPFKEEQKRSQELAYELQTCRADCADLKVKAQENKFVLENLQTGWAGLVDQKNTAEHKARELSEELDQMRLKLKFITQEARDASTVAEEVLRQQELSHFAAMTAKDETLDSDARRIASLESKAGHIEMELQSSEFESEKLSVELAGVHETIKERDARITELEILITSYKADSDHQSDTLEINAVEMETLKCKITEFQSEVERLILKEKQSNDNFDLVIADLEKNRGYEIATTDAEILRQGLEHERAYTALRNELAATTCKAERQTEMHDAQIGELSGKLEALQKERAMRAKEFAQAQDLGSKLMALMGRNSGPPAAACSPATSKIDTQFALHRSFGSSTLSKKNGSIPKRTRVQRKVRTPTVSSMRLSTESKTLQNTKLGRRPLQDLVVDMRNDTVVVYDQSTRDQDKCESSPVFLEETINEKENILWQDMHNFSFTGSHVSTSTDYSRVHEHMTEDAPGRLDRAIANL